VAEVCKSPLSLLLGVALGVGLASLPGILPGSNGCRPAKPKEGKPAKGIFSTRHIIQRHRPFAAPANPAEIFQGKVRPTIQRATSALARRWPSQPKGAPNVLYKSCFDDVAYAALRVLWLARFADARKHGPPRPQGAGVPYPQLSTRPSLFSPSRSASQPVANHHSNAMACTTGRFDGIAPARMAPPPHPPPAMASLSENA